MLLALLGTGCASAPLAIAPLIQQGRANVLAATAELSGRWLSVTGVVTETGLRSVEQFRAERVYPTLWSNVTLTRESVGIPYAAVRDAKAGAGSGLVFCYFPTEAMAAVGRLQPNMPVVMSGQFQEYAAEGSMLVLTACELD
jgi:hypothetical protein